MPKYHLVSDVLLDLVIDDEQLGYAFVHNIIRNEWAAGKIKLLHFPLGSAGPEVLEPAPKRKLTIHLSSGKRWLTCSVSDQLWRDPAFKDPVISDEDVRYLAERAAAAGLVLAEPLKPASAGEPGALNLKGSTVPVRRRDHQAEAPGDGAILEIPVDLVPLGFVHNDENRGELMNAIDQEWSRHRLELWGYEGEYSSELKPAPRDYAITWMGGPGRENGDHPDYPGIAYYCDVTASPRLRENKSDSFVVNSKWLTAPRWTQVRISQREIERLRGTGSQEAMRVSSIAERRAAGKGGRRRGSGAIEDKDALWKMLGLLAQGEATSVFAAARMVVKEDEVEGASVQSTQRRLSRKFSGRYGIEPAPGKTWSDIVAELNTNRSF